MERKRQSIRVLTTCFQAWSMGFSSGLSLNTFNYVYTFSSICLGTAWVFIQFRIHPTTRATWYAKSERRRAWLKGEKIRRDFFLACYEYVVPSGGQRGVFWWKINILTKIIRNAKVRDNGNTEKCSLRRIWENIFDTAKYRVSQEKILILIRTENRIGTI